MKLFATFGKTFEGEDCILDIATSSESLNAVYIVGQKPYEYKLTYDIYEVELTHRSISINDWKLYKKGNQICDSNTLIK